MSSKGRTDEVLAHALELLGRDHRAELRFGIERVADAQRPGVRRDPFHKLLVDAALHKEPGAGAADLRVLERRHRRARHGGVEMNKALGWLPARNAGRLSVAAVMGRGSAT